MVNITLDKEITFQIPEGNYAAELTQIKPFDRQTARGRQDWIRLLFGVEVPGMRDLECRAGRNFMLSFKPGSELRNFLTPVLGPNFFKENSAKSIDLEKLLVGLKGKVQLSHFYGPDYDKPMVTVDEFVVEGGKD